MGAWGHGNFENDDALDWLAELQPDDGDEAFAEVFDMVIEQKDDYIEAPEAAMALAAAEVLAALLGRPPKTLPDEVTAWLKDKKPPKRGLVKNAIRAVTYVLRESELRQLWEDTDHFADWQAEVEGLLHRLDPKTV